MNCKKTRSFFCAIKIGKVKINSIGKSIKSIRSEEKANFALFNLKCTPSISHINFCIDLSLKKNSFNAIDFLMRLTGETQITLMEKKIELDPAKECCLVACEKNKKRLMENLKKIEKKIEFRENKKLLSKNRLKKLAEEEKIGRKALNGFGENFYSALDNFFIEKSALVVK